MTKQRKLSCKVQDLIQDLIDPRCILHHIIRDPRQLHDPLRDLPVRVYHRMIGVHCLAIDHLHHTDLRDLFMACTDPCRLKIQCDIRIYHFICHVSSPSLYTKRTAPAFPDSGSRFL